MKVPLNSTPAGYWSNSTDPNAPINQDFLRVEIQLDILNGCESSCPGCFIPRKNKTCDLSILYNTLKEGTYSPDEIVIGPTDIFSASNFDELMDDPYLKKLYGISSIAYTSALEEPYEVIKGKLNKIWSLYEGIDRIPDIDFKIVLDLDKYLSNDLSMLEFNKKLELFKEGSVQFRINYYKGIFDKIEYNDLANIVRWDYNSPVLITPNFLNNSNATGKVKDLMPSFIDDLEGQNISQENLDLYTMFDPKFSGYGCANYSFYNNKFYINPFIFDGVIQRTKEFEVKTLDNDYLTVNLELAKNLECIACQYLMSCSERNVPMYLVNRDIDKCILPRKYMHANN